MDSPPLYPTHTLNEALKRLNISPLLPATVKYLQAHAADINADLKNLVLAEITAFSESRNPDVLPELADHGPQHAQEILRLLRGGKIRDMQFVSDYVRRRAEHRFPLEAILHAYRCGHKVYSHWLREAVLTVIPSGEDSQQTVAAMADFTLEYTDVISTVAAKVYVAQTRLLADVAGDQRAELLNILLGGYDESDGRVAKILRNAGYLDRRQSFCVALARTVDPSEMVNPVRTRRIAESFDETLQTSRAKRLIDIRDNQVIIIFSDVRRVSGWSAPNVELAKRIAAELSQIGNAVLIGVSSDVASTSQTPDAYRQATMALELATVTNRVAQFSEISTRQLMLHIAAQELERALPGWTEEFFRIDDKQNGNLVATIRAYANADMNVLKAAEDLAVHPNTIYARFQRIQDVTSLNARAYHPLTELLIVADCRAV